MVSTTIRFGVTLIVLGIAAYFGTGMQSITAMIPAFFGLPMTILGYLGREEKWRRHVMHAAFGVAMIGLLGSLRGIPGMLTLLGGGAVERPAAVIVQSLMALICLIYVVLGVRSFIEARRQQS